jgi:hypothetical protein
MESGAGLFLFQPSGGSMISADREQALRALRTGEMKAFYYLVGVLQYQVQRVSPTEVKVHMPNTGYSQDVKMSIEDASRDTWIDVWEKGQKK